MIYIFYFSTPLQAIVHCYVKNVTFVTVFSDTLSIFISADLKIIMNCDLFIRSDRLYIFISLIKRRGPIINSCGTPVIICIFVYISSSTFCFLFDSMIFSILKLYHE